MSNTNDTLFPSSHYPRGCVSYYRALLVEIQDWMDNERAEVGKSEYKRGPGTSLYNDAMKRCKKIQKKLNEMLD